MYVFDVILCLCVTDRETWQTVMMSTIGGAETNSAGREATTIGLENEKTDAETTGAIGEHLGNNTSIITSGCDLPYFLSLSFIHIH